MNIKSANAPRWLKWFIALLILTGIAVVIATSLIHARDSALLLLCTLGVSTYILALAAFLKTFTK